MLATDKISAAFRAIVEESEKGLSQSAPEAMQEHLKIIISIARHQSDIRSAAPGSCTAEKDT
jgi:hypothetical protein